MKTKFLLNVCVVFPVENISFSRTSLAFIAQGSRGKHTVNTVISFPCVLQTTSVHHRSSSLRHINVTPFRLKYFVQNIVKKNNFNVRTVMYH